jgi:hypothetical protein
MPMEGPNQIIDSAHWGVRIGPTDEDMGQVEGLRFDQGCWAYITEPGRLVE